VFRIYYDDGSTFDGDPFDAPFWGVLIIVEKDRDHGRRIVSNGDYYVWIDGRWRAKDHIGLIDYLQQPGHRKAVCGRMVENDHFTAVYMRADADPDFPARTAYGAFEQQINV
jgi:hypothetical protein